mmetsp:Transcript_25683/g.77406  ORF Transcript_25683/g.77406 Transcript_25683/m.77406 type:complete len:245 (-) Transcript_25683:195-929(-)
MVKDLLPSGRGAAVGSCNLVHPSNKVRRQILVPHPAVAARIFGGLGGVQRRRWGWRARGVEAHLAHESPHPSRRVVAAHLNLVATKVKELVRKDGRQLPDQRIDQLERGVGRGVQLRRRLVRAVEERAGIVRGAVYHHVGPADCPRCCVPRHVDLDHHANRPVRGICHHALEIGALVRQIGAVGPLHQPGLARSVPREGLRVGEVPVERVEPGCRHAVQQLQQPRNWLEVSRRVHHQAAVRERG